MGSRSEDDGARALGSRGFAAFPASEEQMMKTNPQYLLTDNGTLPDGRQDRLAMSLSPIVLVERTEQVKVTPNLWGQLAGSVTWVPSEEKGVLKTNWGVVRGVLSSTASAKGGDAQ